MDVLTRPAWRWLARILHRLGQWCYERAHPVWAFRGAAGWYHRGRRLAKGEPPRWRTVVKADPCVYCGRQSQTVEHVEPRSRGGFTGWTNEVGACERCNAEKADTRLLLFLLERQRRERAAERAAAAARRPRRERLHPHVAPTPRVSSPSRRQTRSFQSGGPRR